MAMEEFFTNRYKVIAPYPSCPFKVGTILHEFMRNTSTHKTWYYAETENNEVYVEKINYPHIFKKLEWWEGRTRNDSMPFYMKNKWNGRVVAVQVHFSTPVLFWYFREGEYNADVVEETKRDLGRYDDYVPATEEEFVESEAARKKELMPIHPPQPEQPSEEK